MTTRSNASLPFGLEADFEALAESDLAAWVPGWRQHVASQLSPTKNGNVPRWLSVIASLPKVRSLACDFNHDAVTIGGIDELTTDLRVELASGLIQLAPWRKGPFDVFGVSVDAEWQSNLKWQRIQRAVTSLSGKRVLDVGCGNGYYAFRMVGLGAEWVTAVDPSALALSQFSALRAFFARSLPISFLPVAMEQLPRRVECFDTVFSMGVLYHRRSPFDHLEHLRESLCDGGQLILETLVLDAPKGEVLVPGGRYAQMRNVWFIPSVLELAHWLKRVGFKQVECVNCSATTIDEQRTTEWMPFHSLQEFLDPLDHAKTIEGYPAPLRAIMVASK